MAKITIASILSGFRSVSAFNTVLQLIGTNLNDKVLYRDNPAGEDNVMKNSLDMNSNTILNLPVPTTGTEPVRFDQLTAFIAGGAIPIQEEGTDIVGIPTKLNFIGPNVTVTDVSGVATINVVDNFVNLTDTPASFTGQANKAVAVNSGETALEFITAAPSLFTGLTDTPASFTGEANKIVSVNAGETALEFTTGIAFKGANIKLTSNITLTAATLIIIDWEAENFDTDSFHDNVTNKSRITIPSGLGITKVEVTFNGDFDTPTTSQIQTFLRKNGTENIAGQSSVAFSGSELQSITTGPISVVDGDYFEMTIFSAVTGKLDNVTGTNFSIKVLSS